MKKESILQDKSEAFAARIIKLYQYLIKEEHESIIAKQIYRSGTSIGANIAESKNAQSGLDFIHKLSIALKEANETEFWLKSLYAGNYINEAGFTSLRDDNEQLIKMLVSSIKTMKNKYGIDDSIR
ncbi:MAG: four helix bundle protein [Prevotella sp.]|nr:four helix bundle protein [Prevotella sp.]MBQ9222962.1 four helix bundle protein [Prevotella sp.]